MKGLNNVPKLHYRQNEQEQKLAKFYKKIEAVKQKKNLFKVINKNPSLNKSAECVQI